MVVLRRWYRVEYMKSRLYLELNEPRSGKMQGTSSPIYIHHLLRLLCVADPALTKAFALFSRWRSLGAHATENLNLFRSVAVAGFRATQRIREPARGPGNHRPWPSRENHSVIMCLGSARLTLVSRCFRWLQHEYPALWANLPAKLLAVFMCPTMRMKYAIKF